MQDEFLTTIEAAHFLRLSPVTLEKYRITGEGPRYVRIGRRVTYQKSELLTFAERRIRRSTSEAVCAA